MSGNSIPLPDLPSVDGLCFRPVRGAEDAAALYAVHQGCLLQDGVDPRSPFEDMPSRAGLEAELSAAQADKRLDEWLVAQVDQQIVGYSRLISWPENDGRWVYLILGWTLPAWRGQGIGTAMLHWGEQMAHRLVKTQHPGVPFEFAANASSTEQDTTALLLREGYYVAYSVLEMGLDITLPLTIHPLPARIEIRPALTEHYRPIADSIAEAYQNEYEDNRYQENFDPADYARRLASHRHNPALWQIAWAGDQIVGQVIPRIENGQAQVTEVSVRPAWRRKGLARALLLRALQGLRERGVEDIRLVTMAEFRTRASELYRSVGFRLLKEYRRYRKSTI